MISEITETMLQNVESFLTNEVPEMNVRIFPSTDTLSDKDFSVVKSSLPTVAFMLPQIERKKVDYQVESSPMRVVNGTQTYGQKLYRDIVDLVFRVRYFGKNVFASLAHLNLLNNLCGQVISVEHDGLSYDVLFDGMFYSDITPNFSNLVHYETEVRIEDIPLRPVDADREVFELKNVIINIGGNV